MSRRISRSLVCLKKNEILPAQTNRLLLTPPDDVRRLLACAGAGSGKSTYLGRGLVWEDFRRSVPTLVIDPIGSITNHFLDRVSRLPKKLQEVCWRRIRVLDMGHTGYAFPFPIYYWLGEESLTTIASRVIEAIRRLDPALSGASIQGYNALKSVGVPCGILLASLGLQIDSAPSLLANPEPYLSRVPDTPETRRAVAYFRSEYLPLPPRERQMRTASFLGKVNQFIYDPVMHATFCADAPCLDWSEFVGSRLCVLVDLHRVFDRDQVAFFIYWIYQYLLEFIKSRGPGRHLPISLVIDEITYVLECSGTTAELIAADLNELLNRIARNMSLWVSLSLQEIHLIPKQVQQTLLTMPAQLLGVTADLSAAMRFSERFVRYNPKWVKKYIPHYVTEMGRSGSYQYLSHHTTEEYTRDEQTYLNSLPWLDLKPFHFLVGIAAQEGAQSTSVHEINVQEWLRVDEGGIYFPNAAVVAEVRGRLVARDGLAVAPSQQPQLQAAAAPVPPPVQATEQPPVQSGKPPTAPAGNKQPARRTTPTNKPAKSVPAPSEESTDTAKQPTIQPWEEV